jgi:hypothetical protein
MGIGLLTLVSLGKENIFLSAEPEITFFKIAYKRYTNYSIEQTPQYFKTTPDFGRKCSVNIGKNADLMGMTYIYVELPNIQMENFNNNTNKKFSWVQKIGLALINYIEIEIGGYIIDRHYGDWLNIWNELSTSIGIKKSYNKMIGNIIDLTNYSLIKSSYKLYIPLSFWFCNDTGLTLPLISLKNTDIKIHVEFNDIDLCYKLSPSHYITILDNICLYSPGELIYQIYQNNKIIGEFIYFDVITQQLYYNPISGKFIIPSISFDSKLKIIGEKSNNITNIIPNSVVVKNEDYFKFNKPSLLESYLLINYIYLDNDERLNFINNEHEYIIQTLVSIPEQNISTINTIYKLPLINPIKLLVWRGIMQSNKNSNNYFDYTINNENIINKCLLIINSINRMELNSIEYYTTLQNYQYNLNLTNGLYMYSFALNPKDLQPSGSLNFSKIEDAYLQFQMNNIINYQNSVSIKCYAIQYNLIKISMGILSLGFN